jgi:hypothetical protein
VAIRAPTRAHLVCELRPVWVVVAIDADIRGELEVDAGPFALMTAPAWRRLMLPLQGESRAAVLLYAKQCRPEAALVVTGCTIHFAERPAMRVAMAVGALVEVELPETAFGGKLG